MKYSAYFVQKFQLRNDFYSIALFEFKIHWTLKIYLLNINYQFLLQREVSVCIRKTNLRICECRRGKQADVTVHRVTSKHEISEEFYTMLEIILTHWGRGHLNCLNTRSRVFFLNFNPINAELNPICYLLALLAHHFLHVSRIRVKSLTLRLLMSYIYGAPVIVVSRLHTTTQHSR